MQTIWILLIASSNSILLSTHVNSDGDGLGSEIAMYYYLKSLSIPLLQYELQEYLDLQVDNDLVGSGHAGIQTNKDFSIKVCRDWIKFV